MRRQTATAAINSRAQQSTIFYGLLHSSALAVIFTVAAISESRAGTAPASCGLSTIAASSAIACRTLDRATWAATIVDDEGNPNPPSSLAIPVDALSQTEAGHYLTAQEAYSAKRWLGSAILFVDVRDLSSGDRNVLPAEVDFNSPVVWRGLNSRPTLAYGFVGGVKRALASRKLGHDAIIVLICDDGRSAALGAELLAQAGVPNAFVVRGGMRGEVGAADVTGWEAQQLPTEVLTAI